MTTSTFGMWHPSSSQPNRSSHIAESDPRLISGNYALKLSEPTNEVQKAPYLKQYTPFFRYMSPCREFPECACKVLQTSIQSSQKLSARRQSHKAFERAIARFTWEIDAQTHTSKTFPIGTSQSSEGLIEVNQDIQFFQ